MISFCKVATYDRYGQAQVLYFSVENICFFITVADIEISSSGNFGVDVTSARKTPFFLVVKKVNDARHSLQSVNHLPFLGIEIQAEAHAWDWQLLDQ